MLLIYDAAKTHLCQAPITPSFKLSVAPNFYVTFSVNDKAFSVNCGTEELVRLPRLPAVLSNPHLHASIHPSVHQHDHRCRRC